MSAGDQAAYRDAEVVAGGTISRVANRDPVRHTSSVGGIRLGLELSTRQAKWTPIDLAPGSDAGICDVPEHEFRTARLEAR